MKRRILTQLTTCGLALTLMLVGTARVVGQAQHGIGLTKGVAGPNGDFDNPQAHAGDEVQVAITVYNLDTANHQIQINSITDTVFGVTGGNLLAAPVILPTLGSTHQVFTTYTLPENICGGVTGDLDVVDTADAAGTDLGTGLAANADAQAEIAILCPQIDVEKTCVLTGTPEDPQIQWSVTVQNTGNTTLFNVAIQDDNGTPADLTDDPAPILVGTLDVGELQSFGPFTYVATFNPSINTVVATGYDALGLAGDADGVVTDIDSCTVEILCNPVIRVDKICEVTGTFGSLVVNFSGTVYNDGNVTLTGVVVQDDQGGGPILVGDLAPGASAPYSGSYPLPADTGCEIDVSDTVTATGTFSSLCPPINGANTVTDTSDPAVCRTPPCCNPAIEVTKVCTVSGTQGNFVVNFSGTVSNTGNVPLTGVVVQDSAGGAPVLVGDIPVGGSVDYAGSYALPAETACDTDVTDTVTATGTFPSTCLPVNGGFTVTDTSDPAVCRTPPCPPAVCIVKTVACWLGEPGVCGTFGEEATGVKSLGDPNTTEDDQLPHFCYRIVVSNCGPVDLVNVVVNDETLGISETIPSLAVGAEYVINVTTGQSEDTVNTATAQGESAVQAGVLTDVVEDTAQVFVETLEVSCVKLISVDGGAPASSVEITDTAAHDVVYSVQIQNSGTIAAQVTITDPLLADCIAATAGSYPLVRTIAAGATETYVLCETTLTCGQGVLANGTFVNTVTISAQVDPEAGEVCDINALGEPVTATSTCQATITCRADFFGCTPGFWKNCQIHWTVTGFATGQLVGSVFELGDCCEELESATLLQALSFGGGSGECGAVRNLLRAAVAALLNASSPELNYPRSTQEVIDDVNAALAVCNRGDILTLAGELDFDNNRGCANQLGELPCKKLSIPPQ